ncbi:ribosome small subunit-dependent GTPase A [Periweissella beninensis]|uniref:Small ribosomal subunit biogenesis GTPase RsgA n=1 Tax=Periweissella beninensis TaxID=504936 RepID=A0ABT0VJ73_9LACO|nr:ribosome small subunit-dependent GTPase A [Periweissella beninensis]MBM7543467.1 ribosome biogenesis GTPase [Periweissella beninensis]MCM2436450.1 ribosome small subunit-dependent GTPase A [Periweissella beninensis]MCT4396818.1 ribosome small subunit-dependent GTPase A [Periweissella beninensis]
MKTGQIRQLLAGFYDVVTDDGKIYRTRARGNFRKKGISPLVGDIVDFQDDNQDEGYILAVHKRTNSLVRPPVANIDLAIMVTAAVEPDFSDNLLDRQLVAVEEMRIKPIIYFTKTDLLSAEQFLKLEAIASGYRAIGYPTFIPKEAFSVESLTALSSEFTGNLSVFMGQTGAGKSTLLNHILPELALATGEISQALNRGKHTTRMVGLHEINGGLVADTPGFSSYEVFNMPAQELTQFFPEFWQASEACRFRGCVHINEPGCVVKAKVDSGEFMKTRYNNYCDFYNLIINQKPDYRKIKKVKK